jgi:3-methyl-2-oxobutanoate hydroxymethyltransferase
MNVLDFKKMKEERRKISMVTCYDYGFAQILNSTNIDCLLVGDSLAMVQHGHTSTLPATSELMALHVRAVVRGAPDKFVVGDMPFLAHRKGLSEAMNAVQTIMSAGAHAVKIEGVDGHADLLAHIVQSGVPVVGHLGLTPQSINQFGGFKVQGKDAGATDWLTAQAKAVEEAGCVAVVLECVPRQVAQFVSENISIPTIGIGAGPDTDGQVLVLNDLLGLNSGFKPKFLRTYLQGFELVQSALNQYDKDVKAQIFPSESESYR